MIFIIKTSGTIKIILKELKISKIKLKTYKTKLMPNKLNIKISKKIQALEFQNFRVRIKNLDLI
jgi:hypothetical protein